MHKHTIIPDIHADPARLEASLAVASDRIVFLGDLIDAGSKAQRPSDREVLERVKGLIDAGRAKTIMGNHELNAILFHRTGASGEPLRKRSAKNIRQHQSFVDDFGIGTPEALRWTSWFLTHMPLWHEEVGLRVVHACWSDKHVEIVRSRRPDGFLRDEDLEEVAAEQTEFARAVSVLIKGPEIALPSPHVFHDYQGTERHEVRFAWWNAKATTWPEAVLSVPDPNELPQSELPQDALDDLYPADAPPVLVGHYKMAGALRIESHNAASIDFPESACVYEWGGGQVLSASALKRVAV